MQTSQQAESFQALAERVDGLLSLMSGALRTANHPHHLARSSLGVNKYGWTETPYNDEAQRIWEKLHNQDPDDIEALHHLAILHHARAFDLECGPSAEAANGDWEKALRYWHELCQQEGFWDRLSHGVEATKKRAALIEELKSSWQEQLLQVHFDIAFDHATSKLHRANYHLRLALQSPFPEQIKERVRQRTYEHCLEGLDSRVWDKEILDPDIIDGGTQVIARYLERDPGCIVALCDLVRLQTRLANAWLQQWHAAGDDECLRAPIERHFAEAIKQWQPYLDRLLDRANEIEEEAREKLCRWYQNAAAIHRHWQKKYPEAVSFYMAAQKATVDDEERRQIAAEIAETLAEQARSLAESPQKQDLGRARELADRVLGLPELNTAACLALAQTYAQLRDLEQLIKACEVGLQIEADTLDFNEIEKAECDKEALRQFLDAARRGQQLDGLLEKAMAALHASQYEKALPLLDQMLEINDSDSDCYLLRCKCNLALARPDQARADLAALRQLAVVQGDQDRLKFADEWLAQCEILAQELKLFGREGWELRSKGLQASNSGKENEAEEFLRRAINSAPRAGHKQLEEELAIVLRNRAVSMVQQALENPNTNEQNKIDTCRNALGLLQEASRFAPKIKEDWKSLQTTIGVLEQHVRIEKEYGGPRAFAFQQQAVEAFNRGQYEEAVSLLRKAIEVASGENSAISFLRVANTHAPAKLKTELSQALVAAAVSHCNSASNKWSTFQEARSMFEESLEWDPRNEQAKTNLAIIKKQGLS